MSVPAFRNSKAKVRRRRSHHALKPIQVQHDKDGNVTLPHRKMSVSVAVAPKAAVKAKKEAKEEKVPVARKVAPEKKVSNYNIVVKKVTKKAGRKK